MKNISMLINANDKLGHINKEIYGHFSEHLGRCIYGGIFVGEDSDIENVHGIRKDVIDAFKNIRMPVLRWPGGCFADEYHWKDGIGKKQDRKKLINLSWGGVTEDNSFGTHEFFELCELVGCEPYLAANVGSGTVRELVEWIEYVTSPAISPMADERRRNGREEPWHLKYLGIGNENWGCGGNMTAEYYADVYKQYSTFCKDHGDNHLYKIACGASSSDYNWTDVMMKKLKNLDSWWAKGLSLHFYSIPDWNNKGTACEFSDEDYYELLNTTNYTDKLISTHSGIMDRYDPECKIGLIVDEWGTWYDVEEGTNPAFLYQQNTMRDAIVAAISLNIFNRHSKRVKMANLAQAVNVLQALILTEGRRMIKTPTYHVFDLFKNHQEGDCVYCHSENFNMAEGKNTPALTSSASVKDGVLTLTAANCSIEEDIEVSCRLAGFEGREVSARILTNDLRAFNDFDTPDTVKIIDHSAKLDGDTLTFTLPKCSVAEITVK